MKVAFFFDTYLLKRNKDYYGMTLTYDFFRRRYLTLFDEIVVSTRVKNIEEEKGNYEGYKKTNGNRVEVKPILSYRNFLDILKNHLKIKNEIKEVINNVDRVIIRMPSVIGIYACKLCQNNSKSYIVEMVACPWDGYMHHTNRLGKIVAPFMYLMTKNAIKNAREVIYVSNSFLQKRYPTKGNSYSCSDVELERNDIDILDKRLQKINNIKDEISLITVGNVGMRYKGQEYVIKALSLLDEKYKYYLVGNGDFNRLQKIAIRYGVCDRVIFLGSLKHEEVFEILKKMDIYIQPSLQEGLPRALIEAMSMACPCIGSNVGGIPELINVDCIFNKKNYKSLAVKVKQMNKEKMKLEAENNYIKSLKYSKKFLNEKRKNIMKQFR